jgi:DNA-binding MarR family transcriptional regulator
MREECFKFADRLAGLFSEIIFKTLTVKLLRDLEELDITLSQLHALTHVGERRHCSIGAIADGLGVTHPAAVKMVDRLLKKGLVSRSVSSTDHRQAEIQITPEGRELVHRVSLERTERLARVLERMTPEDRLGLIRGLERFVAASLDSRALDEICRCCQTFLPTDCKDWIPEAVVIGEEMDRQRATVERTETLVGGRRSAVSGPVTE